MAIEKNTTNLLRHEQGGFTTLINETLQNIKHTGALGVYCYLASKPSNWNICKEELKIHFRSGREHIDTCLKYLKEIELLRTEMQRNERGQCIGWVTILRRKIPDHILANIQNTGFPSSGELSRIRVSQILGKPDSGFPAPINKRALKKKEEKKIKTSTTNPELPKTSSEPPKPSEPPTDSLSSFSFSFSSKQQTQLLDLKLSQDLRSESEFLGNALHHIQNNSKPELHLNQRVAGLIRILMKCKAQGELFKSKGYTPEAKKEERIPTQEDFENYKQCVPGYEWVWARHQELQQLKRA